MNELLSGVSGIGRVINQLIREKVSFFFSFVLKPIRNVELMNGEPFKLMNIYRWNHSLDGNHEKPRLKMISFLRIRNKSKTNWILLVLLPSVDILLLLLLIYFIHIPYWLFIDIHFQRILDFNRFSSFGSPVLIFINFKLYTRIADFSHGI